MEPEHIDVTVATGLPRQPDTHQDCRGVASVLSRVGDKWSVLILAVLGTRPHRFGELRREIAQLLTVQTEQQQQAREFPTNPRQLEAGQ